MVSASSKVVSILKKMIKPSSPTPLSLRRHNLSLLDQLVSPAHHPVAFFYPKHKLHSSNDQIHLSQLLENSFAKLLTAYYPFAGTIHDNVFVDCNDTGAEFFNVQVDCSMFEILRHPYSDATNLVYPQGLPWNSSYEETLVAAQLTHFNCGGRAVSICFSHKVADAYSIIKFIFDWAALTRDLGAKPSPLLFNGNSFFPQTSDPSTLPDFEPKVKQCVTRLYHFSSSALDRLKAIATTPEYSGVVQNLTGVEVATALLYKCAVAAASTKSGAFRPSFLYHVMSLRPPLPLNTIGNGTSFFFTSVDTEDEMKIPNLVAQLRKSKHQLYDKLKNINVLESDQLFQKALEVIKEGAKQLEQIGNHDMYRCSSLRNFGLYNADFGWGKPTRVASASPPIKNHMFFWDSPSGNGLDVAVTLERQDMEIFECDPELLQFASLVVE